jgi:DNA-binding MarR family transcriptional regulator
LTDTCHYDRLLAIVTPRTNRTTEGDAATDVVLRTFRANGTFLAAGDRLAASEGLTAARWQVIGAVALAQRALTVPQIARRMGLTRQSVQASVNRLLAEGLLEADGNPDHRRSPLIRLTDRGRDTYVRLQSRQARWINELSAGLDVSELATTARVLEELNRRLDAQGRDEERTR